MNDMAFQGLEIGNSTRFGFGMRGAIERRMKSAVKQTRSVRVPELVLAAHAGREEDVRKLLGDGADVNATDCDGITPLMAAAMSGCLSLARLLLASGADLSLRNKWGMSAHAIALWHGYEALAAVLNDSEVLSCGPRPNSEKRKRS